MIHYALIIRSRDGMALTASTDFSNDIDKNLKQVKVYMKLIAKKSTQFPERCSMRVGSYIICFVTSLGISYLVLCDDNYPTVLAFSFINELMKEFLSQYDTRNVNEARRPYTFIAFDNVIHKIRQRYNRPQSLTTRVDLSELSKELKIRPPHNVLPQEVEPPPLPNGMHRHSLLNNVSVGPPRKLKPIPFYGKIAFSFTLLLCLFNFYRSVISLGQSNIEEYDGPNPTHGFLFLFEGFLQILQIYVLYKAPKNKKLVAGISYILIVICGVLLWDTRENWFAVFSLIISFIATVSTFKRCYEAKPPNYNV